MTMAEREALSLSFKWQYQSIDHVHFFGSDDDPRQWDRLNDYPLRFLLHKINRDTWRDLEYSKWGEDAILTVASLLDEELQEIRLESPEVDEDDSNGESDAPEPRSIRQLQTFEVDHEEYIEECLDDDWFDAASSAAKVEVDWNYLPYIFSLLRVSEAAEQLTREDVPLAAVNAMCAQRWYFMGGHRRGIVWGQYFQRREQALSGADAAHTKNRQVKLEALKRFDAGNWKSKIQAARTLAPQVHRTELVVLRWIREHTRKK